MKLSGKLAMLLAGWALSAASVAAADVKVDQPWARATVPGQPASGVFMTLTVDEAARLVAAESPVAQNVEIHEMAMHDNTMRMRQVPALDMPAGEPVVLAPGGYHIMLIGLHRQLKEGEHVDLTLAFEYGDGRRETVRLDVPVRALTHDGAGASAGAHSHHGHSGAHAHGDAHGHSDH